MPAVYLNQSGHDAVPRSPRHETPHMQSTPPGQPSPFDDGELYDIICHGLDYGIEFYVGLSRKAKGPVLDVACGTGRVLMPVLQAGADADGLDLFQPMLDTARRKADALGLSPALRCGDMADFQMPRRYALVMITFNAFCHMLTTDDQLRCLGCIRRHLRPGGLLAFDGAFPGLAWIGAPQDKRELEGETQTPAHQADAALLRHPQFRPRGGSSALAKRGRT